jgi:phosphatidate cytidylyltransferase
MLRTRVITAVLLLAGFLCALFVFPPIGWALAMTLVAVLGAWEWGGLMHLSGVGRAVYASTTLLLCAGTLVAYPEALGLRDGLPASAWDLGHRVYPYAALFWLLAVPVWLIRRWTLSRKPIASVVGWVVVFPAWLALIHLRQLGPITLLAIMAIVWIADIGAYFSGRALGRHKLAPTISPGKTWEGAVGGAIAVVAYGLVMASGVPQISGVNRFVLVMVLLFLAGISVVGDLFESLLKRQAGLKDSSQILPGHGGVLDRIDSITSSMPFVALLWFWPPA